MLLQLVLLVALSGVSFFLVAKNPHSVYLYTCLIAFVISPVIFFERPLGDEICLLFVSICCIFRVIQSRSLPLSRLWKCREELLLSIFLFLNSLFGLIYFQSISNARFTLIFFTYIILILYFSKVKQDTSKVAKYSLNAFGIYLYCWIAYWLVLSILGIDWTNEQARSLSGSAQAAIVPFIGIYLLAQKTNLREPIRKTFSFWVNLTLSLLAAFLYDSRVFYLTLIVLIFVILFQYRSMKVLTYVVASFIAVALFSNILGNLSLLSESNSTSWFLNQTSNSERYVQLINNPRTSDADRSIQISCSTRIIMKESSFKNQVFGYGQNQHKKVMVQCTPDIERLIVRPVGFAAYLVDFGLFGLFGFFVVFVKRIIEIMRSNLEKKIYFLLILIFVMSWSLITNYLDNSVLLVVFFTSYFLNFVRDDVLAKLPRQNS